VTDGSTPVTNSVRATLRGLDNSSVMHPGRAPTCSSASAPCPAAWLPSSIGVMSVLTLDELESRRGHLEAQLAEITREAQTLATRLPATDTVVCLPPFDNAALAPHSRQVGRLRALWAHRPFGLSVGELERALYYDWAPPMCRADWASPDLLLTVVLGTPSGTTVPASDWRTHLWRMQGGP